MRLPCVLVMVCLAGAAQAQDRPSGDWQGYWARAGDTMPVTMSIRHDSTTNHYSATFAADRLRVSGIPFNEVRLEGCCEVRLLLRGDRTTIEFTGRLHGDSLSGVLTDSDGDGRFAFARVPAPTPQFEERDITFSSGAVTLAGPLLPLKGDSLAAVVFLHGSGAEGRWASRFLAAKLAGRGIATLIFDKRGVGGSSGDWRHATPDDLAADGAAAVARLHQESRIDPRRIGIHGHSQGGTLAPLVVARATGIAFVIGSAASGLPTDSTELFSILNFVHPTATSAADSASASAYTNEVIAVAYHGRPRARMDSLATALRDRPWFFAPPPPGDAYWSFSPVFAKYQALEWWARVRVPVLLMYGAEDQRVPAAESAARIAAALRDAGNADVTVRILPGADHTFRLPPGPGGWPVTAPDYLPSLLDWLRKR
jgi:dienelactone hydrolase